MIRFAAYSDYLCPWCWNASRRLMHLADEFEGRIEIAWKSYLLRPVAKPKPNPDPERFRRYTESWLRPAAEDDAGEFRIWSNAVPPVSHSLPAHCAAKAAARFGSAAFRTMHEGLMSAYFHDNRDISDFDLLEGLWLEVGLPRVGFSWARTAEAVAAVQDDFAEALRLGATGVPGLRRCDNEVVIVGAQPIDVIRRWFEKSLAQGIETPAGLDPGVAPSRREGRESDLG
jgi:predicted DsbA family dithiol-disulfide isomerase